jgi:dTDP-4-amino-4,6-dideoxygalactose transaminase
MTADQQVLDAHQAILPSLARMPDPVGRPEAVALEAELAAAFGSRHAVAVSSGTAALHTALAACGIGHGDEVLVPAATVIMTVAAVVAVGARPVFFDTPVDGRGVDLEDVAAKTSPRTRAIVPVHLAGRTDGIHELAAYTKAKGLYLVEDACQAQGSRTRGRLAGSIGDIGCFSLKDGKLIFCGEGGYLLTDDDELAARAAAFRSHWQTHAGNAPAGSRLGLNFRLAEPLAALARHHLVNFESSLGRRREQDRLLHKLLDPAPGLVPVTPAPDDDPNGFSALWRIGFDRPRAFSTRLAELGVANSVGTHRLTAAPEHPACRSLEADPCPNAVGAVDQLLAVSLSARTSDEALHETAATIRREAARWTP